MELGDRLYREGRRLSGEACGDSFELRNDLLWFVGTNSLVRKVYALPPEKARVDRPCARSEKCQGGTEGSEQDITPRIMRMREGAPYLNDCQKCSRDGRP